MWQKLRFFNNRNTNNVKRLYTKALCNCLITLFSQGLTSNLHFQQTEFPILTGKKYAKMISWGCSTLIQLYMSVNERLMFNCYHLLFCFKQQGETISTYFSIYPINLQMDKKIMCGRKE